MNVKDQTNKKVRIKELETRRIFIISSVNDLYSLFIILG